LIGRVIDDVLRQEEEWHRRPSNVWGLPTGFESLNAITGGLHPDELTVLAARPSIGKTSLAIQIVFAVALHLIETEQDGQVVFFETEMTDRQILMRYASQISGVPTRLIQRGLATPAQRQSWREVVREAGMFERVLALKAGKSVEVDDIYSFVATEHKVRPIRLLVVDHLQRLRAGFREDGYSRTSYAAVRLKDLANSFSIPVIVLCQLNRRTEARDGDLKRPSLSDLRESGRIEEEADNVWLLYRPNRRARQEHQVATLEIAKNRNGPTDEIELLFLPEITKFQDFGDETETEGDE
jgi:replicative DNA helicase